jgi:hypothetical protein
LKEYAADSFGAMAQHIFAFGEGENRTVWALTRFLGGLLANLHFRLEARSQR